MQTEAEVQSFLKDAGWAGAQNEPLASDFSARLFSRLSRDGAEPRSAVLMRAQADSNTDAFVHMCPLLRRLGVAAPDLYASDIVRDLVLMQDFGNLTVGRALDQGEDRDHYDEQAAAVLAKIHKSFDQRMLGALKSPLYNAALFADQATMFLDFYYPRVFKRQPTARERSNFVEAWHGVLSPLDSLPRSLVLRDYMPDNMMVLPEPVLGWPVGLLDFQDAGLGPVAYDIASWCESVRRDGGVERLNDFVMIYHKRNTAVDVDTLLRAAHIFSAQRHTRILGKLVELDRTAMVPRVWKALQTLLKYPELSPVRHWFASCQPSSS